MPFHKGHKLLMQFALQFVDKLYVVIDKVENEFISGEMKKRWIIETFPQANVISLATVMPQTPAEHPHFWEHWKEVLITTLPQSPDFLFASEAYGIQLANVLGAQFIPFDQKRSCCSVSATDIRADLLGKWEHLAQATRKDFLLKICLFGPESTGKTTLATELAAHYQTVYVPEYARSFIETTGQINKEDMLTIAKGQIALEKILSEKANRLLFCDTDPLLTSLWHQWLFRENSQEIEDLALEQHYDLYLLMDADLEWMPDPVRYFPEKGEECVQACESILQQHKKNYAIITGKGSLRLQNAILVVDEIVKQFFNKWK